ncbi:MAG TPA: hypothetical protein VMJ10_32980 [Kofleriaceae bacterium]|nr:hypothetical protein [Kofleriaceae bacterium]
MRYGSALAVLCLTACSSAGVGDHCADRSDCGGSLQCVADVCVPGCQRAPDCGDGYACEPDGTCREATGQLGDTCTSEVECAPGLSCSFDPMALTSLDASCVAESAGRAPGETCAADSDCRNGTCAIGRCVDLCDDTRDCVEGTACTLIPRVEAGGRTFSACLAAFGTIAWNIPIPGPSSQILLPIPSSATSVAVTFEVEDPLQLVGATSVIAPDGVHHLVTLSDDSSTWPNFSDPVRHEPAAGQSVLAMPSSPATPLVAGAYSMIVKSLHRDGSPGSATPTATAVIKVDAAVLLDLHFYFLDFTDHPCTTAFTSTMTAATAQTASFFQNDYLGALRSVFADGGVSIGGITYEDITDHPELDSPEATTAASLLALGAFPTGVNIFFVRTLSPIGLQAFGPNPGPAGLANTPQSGVIVSLDTLCYQNWAEVARLTAHEVAKYMGLYENVDLNNNNDPIGDDVDSTPSDNLMFNSELGGTTLSPGQRAILSRSVVLQ